MTATLSPSARDTLYSPLSFLRDQAAVLAAHVSEWRTELIRERELHVEAGADRWYWRRLGWDSDHFGVDIVRLEFAEWDPPDRDASQRLAHQMAALTASLIERYGRCYVFAELPAEDVVTVGALGLAGFRLIETRLAYHAPDVADLELPAASPVRAAAEADIPHLREVAARTRNPFDRYHADPFFSEAEADAYLATYAEACVRGLADVVLVPDPDDGAPPGALFAGTISRPPACPLGLPHDCPIDLVVGRMPLAAVSAERRGWFRRLLAEITRHFVAEGVTVAYLTTQASNRAVIRNCETLGYRLGRTTHVFSKQLGADDAGTQEPTEGEPGTS